MAFQDRFWLVSLQLTMKFTTGFTHFYKLYLHEVVYMRLRLTSRVANGLKPPLPYTRNTAFHLMFPANTRSHGSNWSQRSPYLGPRSPQNHLRPPLRIHKILLLHRFQQFLQIRPLQYSRRKSPCLETS